MTSQPTSAPTTMTGMYQTPEGPEVVQAVSLALAVMRRTKKTWGKSRDDLPPDLGLSPEQVELLDKFSTTLEHVHPAVVEDADTTVTVFGCTECGCWGYIGSAAAPRRCGLTLRCAGEIVKAKAAAKA